MAANKRAALLQRAKQAKQNDVPVKEQSNPIEDLSVLNENIEDISKTEDLEEINKTVSPVSNTIYETSPIKNNEKDVEFEQINENVSCETTKCTNPEELHSSLNDETSSSFILGSEMREIKDFNINIHECSSWGTSISYESFTALEFYLTRTNWKKFQLINNIIKSDIEWVKAHPEFPSMEFVMEQIRAKSTKNKNDISRIQTTLTLTKDALEHIKIMSKRCSMTMYEYAEYLIKQYIK